MFKQRLITNIAFIFLLAGAMACSTTEKSQKDVPVIIFRSGPQKLNRDSVFVVVQQMPELVGSRSEFQSHVEYPKSCREAGAEGVVAVRFTVTKTGELTNFKVIKGIGWGCDEAAVRALKRYAEFTPGTSNGKPIPVRMTFPVVFHLDR